MSARTLRCLLAGGLILAACSPAPPSIRLEDEWMDLGVVSNGEVVTIRVGLVNAGGSDLVIEAVTTSCGCTQASVEPATIAAGESGELVVTFDSGAHGPEYAGEALRQVFIASNDPDERELVFEFRARVEAPSP